MSARRSKSQSITSASAAAENRFERHPRLTLTVILLSSIGLALFAAEMIARWVHPLDTGTSSEYRVPDPRFGWVLAPGANYVNRLPEEAVPVSYNADGWRDQPRAQDKAKGVMRVLVLGDSFMEAYSVRFEDALPARLERLIGTAERRVEVINLGVGGYGTLQEYLVFNAVGRGYQPDVVVLAMFLGNDLIDNSQELTSLLSRSGLKVNARPFLDPRVSEPGWVVTQVDYEGALKRYEKHRRRAAEPLNRLLRHSALLQTGRRALELVPLSWWTGSHSKKGVSWLLANFCLHYREEPPEFKRSWDVTRRILARLNRDVRGAGARLLVMSVPGDHEVEENRVENDNYACVKETFSYRRLGKLLDELDIDYLDLLPAFRDARRQTRVELFRRSDGHWNPQGHALAARELAAAIEHRGYLDSPVAGFFGDKSEAPFR
jgi:lysophospholipase L1-like esterase